MNITEIQCGFELPKNGVEWDGFHSAAMRLRTFNAVRDRV